MKLNFHGIFSLFLASIAITISIYVLINHSLLLGLCYSFFCLLCLGIILRVFCAKCPGRETCGHLIPGIIVSKLFPGVTSKPFTNKELLLLSFIIILIVGIPQYWLFRQMEFLITYWLILLSAGIEIKFTVCTKCKNEFCPSNPLFKGLLKKVKEE